MQRIFTRAVTRKQLIIFAVIAVVLFFSHQSGLTRLRPSSLPLTHDPCPSNHTFPLNLKPPPPPDQKYLDALWNSLHQNFEIHPPSPRNLPTPKHGNFGFPPEHKVGSFFDMNEEFASQTRETNADVISKLPSFPSGKFHGRGVVMLAGARYSEYASTSLNMLREVGSKLPLELWLRDASEETPHWCGELEQMGGACRRLSDYMDVKVLKHPYQWKVFTLVYSSFSEILFLDADSMPVKNPDFIFESQPYRDKGVILWPDYWNNTASPWAPYVTGISDEAHDRLQEEKSVESGQIVWNKKRHWRSLLLAAYYNYWGPDYFYTMFNNGFAGYGDKDTFPIALKALREPYYHVPLGIFTAFVTGKMLGVGMLQADPTHTDAHVPLFMHSNIVKWSARKFFCDNRCPRLGEYELQPTHVVNSQSPIYVHLQDGVRVFKQADMLDHGVDPEPTMWIAMERAACRSVAWGNARVCDLTRAHMTRTFGFTFKRVGTHEGVGPANQVCLVPPAPSTGATA